MGINFLEPAPDADGGQRLIKPARPFLRWAFAANAALVLLIAITFRMLWLDNIPGINGDEMSGTGVLRFLRGGDFPWITPSNRPASATYLLSAIVALKLGGPTFLMARVPAVFWGLLFILVVYLGARRMLDRRASLLLTLLVACHPAHIAFSRIGWECSQTGLFTALVLVLACLRHWIWAAVFLVFGIVDVHPAIAFVMPALLGLLIGRGVEHGILSSERRVAAVLGGIIMAVTLLLIGLWNLRLSNLGTVGFAVIMGIDQVLSPGTYATLFPNLLRYLSGASAIHDFTGSLTDRGFTMFAVLAAVALVLSFGLAVVGALRAKEWGVLGLVVGTALSLCSVAGVPHLLPVEMGHTRYGLGILVPVVFVSGYALHYAIRGRWFPRASMAVTVVLCWAFLGSFWFLYFDAVRKTGGTGPAIYRTGRIDPKLSAYEWIKQKYCLTEPAKAGAIAAANKGGPLIVLVKDPWIYNVFLFFATRDSLISVYRFYQMPREVVLKLKEKATPVLMIDPVGGSVDRWVQTGEAGEVKLVREETGYGGRPILKIWEWPPRI